MSTKLRRSTDDAGYHLTASHGFFYPGQSANIVVMITSPLSLAFALTNFFIIFSEEKCLYATAVRNEKHEVRKCVILHFVFSFLNIELCAKFKCFSSDFISFLFYLKDKSNIDQAKTCFWTTSSKNNRSICQINSSLETISILICLLEQFKHGFSPTLNLNIIQNFFNNLILTGQRKKLQKKSKNLL